MDMHFMPAVDGFACDEAPEQFRTVDALRFQGIGYRDAAMADAMDESPFAAGEAGVNAPWFYLNYMAKNPIKVVTQRTTADEALGGRTTDGASWAHVSITKTVRELTGKTGLYKDFADTTAPRVNRAYTRVTRDIVRLSAGLVIGELEKRQSAMVPGMYSPYQDKREAIALAFNLDRDAIAYFGYQFDGLNNAKCYGLLNDESLDPFVQVASWTPAGGSTSSTTWADKDAHAIIADIMTAVAAVQVKCKANFIPGRDKFRIVIPVGCDAYLGKITECGGYSVRQWIKDNYPKADVVLSPVFDKALGGTANVFYIIVDKLGASPVVEQIVPASIFMVGSMKRETGHSELWSMATAGCFVEQPLGIVRYFGI